MRWLKRLFGRSVPVEIHVQPAIEFVGEQVGDVEQNIKSQWLPIFARDTSVREAYLSVATYDHGTTFQPVLCVKRSGGANAALVDALAEPFRRDFSDGQALDIVFLQPEQERLVKLVCEAFYVGPR